MARRPASPSHGCAWVTGASSGIGYELVGELVRRGWRVAASARSEAVLAKLADAFPGRVIAAPCDVAIASEVETAASLARSAFGPIGLAISNAGVYLPFEGQSFSIDLFERTVRANLLGASHVTGAVLPDFCSRQEGHIHFVSSATGFGGMPTSSAYGATKAGLINMAECLKIEVDRYRVGVSVSTPGIVETPAQDHNTFPKPFMIQPSEAARRIADAVMRGGFETSFPRRFTWPLKAIYALPKFVYLPLVRAQTGWNRPPDSR